MAASKRAKDPDSFTDKANANGGVTVTGYLSGVIGVTTSGIAADESECLGGWHGPAMPRTGGGTGSVMTAERARGNDEYDCPG